MKKRLTSLLAVGAALFLFSTQSAHAQLSNFINSTVETVTTAVETTVTSSSAIVGTWSYSEPASKLESSSTLATLGSAAATTQIDAKLLSAYNKLGISSSTLSFVFSDSQTFTNVVLGKTLSGSYELSSSNDELTLSYQAYSTVSLGTVAAAAELTSTTLTLYYEADMLLEMFTSLSSESNNTSLSTLSSLLSQYDGLLIGFKMKKN